MFHKSNETQFQNRFQDISNKSSSKGESNKHRSIPFLGFHRLFEFHVDLNDDGMTMLYVVEFFLCRFNRIVDERILSLE